MISQVKNMVKNTPWMLRTVKGVKKLAGCEEELWGRVVMLREKRRLVAGLGPERLRALEISGRHYENSGFLSYANVFYPDFDICTDTLDTGEAGFDLVISQQVFEHLKEPERAAANVLAMLAPGGHFLISTPFFVRIHPDPLDFIRWSEDGLRRFLVQCGFEAEGLLTGSWGNRACIRANMRRRWVRYNRYFHSLKNEPEFPVHVWALARKAG
jgi:SAM-dependent methyltransferase